jgi:hypothetical protein
MNSHLSDEQLIGYVHHTLTDAQREAMDQHLASCAECRARLAEHETLQRRIRHSLLADLNGVQPSPTINFSTVAPRLKRRNWPVGLWRGSGRLLPSVTAAAALAGLVIALVGLVRGIHQPVMGFKTSATGSLPAAACVFFAIPIISNYFESRTVPTRLILSSVLAFILWVGTAIVGLQAMVVLRNIFIWVLLQFMDDLWSAVELGNWILLPLGVAWIALVIGGGEYHWRRLGQRSSWRLFGWTIAVELLIVSLFYL